MTKKIIDIHTVVDGNSINYYNYMIKSHQKMKSKEYDFRFFAYLLKIKSSDLSYEMMQKIYKSYDLDVKTIKSQGHGDSMTLAVRNASDRMKNDKCEYSVFADTDTAICMKNWDLEILQLLEKNGIVGTKYEDIGMPCAGSGKVQVYKNTPNCTWFALSKRYDFSKIDLHARNNPSYNQLIDTEEMSQLYKLPIGYTVNFDTGWQWAAFCRDNNVPYYVFENGNPLIGKTPEGNTMNVLVKPYFNTDVLPRHVAQYPEQHMMQDGRTFLVHQRGSLKHDFRNNEHSTHFYNAYESFCFDKVD